MDDRLIRQVDEGIARALFRGENRGRRRSTSRLEGTHGGGERLKIDIDTLTEAELIDLNHRAVERLRFLQQARSHAAMLQFRIGDRVEYRPEGRPPVAGMLNRYNKRTVTVITDGGRRWNVSPRLLRRLEER